MPKSVSAAGNGVADIMAEHFYSREARIDLLEIWEYIAHDNIDAADRVVAEIESAVLMLAQNPTVGHARRDLTSKPVRFWSVYSYLVIYDPASQLLEIVRILSGYQDIAAILK